MTTSTLYVLAFEADDEPIVFYVGHTNDVERRRSEHMNNPLNPNHSEYTTYKYQWARSLIEMGIEYKLIPLHKIETDDDTEYEWILKFARRNADANIAFYDGYPLTNMKAGDFLTEIIDKRDITTAEQITRYRTQRSISYLRDGTGELTPIGKTIVAQLQVYAEKVRAENAVREQKKFERENAQLIQLRDAGRQERLRAETIELLDRELSIGGITYEEYQQSIKDLGGQA